jgi:5-methyltetrahydrofolate--homocysteine methyltransferase
VPPPDATERLIALAESYRGTVEEEKQAPNGAAGRSRSGSSHALVKGIDAHIVEDTEEARLEPRPAAADRSR